MTREQETELMDLKDRLLDAIHQVDELMCGGAVVHYNQGDVEDDPDDDLDVEHPDDEDEGLVMDGVVDPSDAGRKKQKPIQYDLAPRRRDVAFKEHP